MSRRGEPRLAPNVDQFSRTITRVLGLIPPGTGNNPPLAREEIRVVLTWVEELKARVK